MKLKELFDFLPKSKIQAGEGKVLGNYPFFTSSDTKRLYLDTYEYDDELVIIGTGGKPSCNYYNGKFSASTDNIILKSKGKTLPKYLYYFLRNNSLSILEKGFHGSGLKHVGRDYISNIDVPIIEIEKQKYIIDLLDNLNNAISIKQQQLKDLDELVKSRFNEMFGNEKNYIKLNECCTIHARIGWQALTTAEHKTSGDYLLITGTDFKDGKINYDTCCYVSKERYDMDKNIQLKNNDILITKDGTIGKVAIVSNLVKPAALNSGIFVLRTNENYNSAYISSIFESGLFDQFIQRVKTGATIKHLNQACLLKFQIPNPPLTLQNEFLHFKHIQDKLKEKNISTTKHLVDLLNVEMNKFFC